MLSETWSHIQNSLSMLDLTALTPQNIDDTIKSIIQGLADHLQQIVDISPKSYLLAGRMELDVPSNTTGPPSIAVLWLYK